MASDCYYFDTHGTFLLEKQGAGALSQTVYNQRELSDFQGGQ